MSKILVLQGVPASGKSTWAKEFVKNKKDWVIVSRDSIRESTGNYWVPSREDYISYVEEVQVISALDNDLNVIIDATNLNPKTIDKWKNIASKLDCEITFQMFEIDFKTALERDSNRERRVGKNTLEQFFSKYFPEKLKDYYTDNRKIKLNDPNKQDCIICDLDGTLCLHQGRSPYDLSKVLEDKPNEQLIKILTALNMQYPIIFLSGREDVDNCKNDTITWISNNYMSKISDSSLKGWDLKMRNKNDYRPDEVIKEEIYHSEIEPHYNVLCVFDDRDKVVKMWRDLGLLCNQVYYGNF